MTIGKMDWQKAGLSMLAGIATCCFAQEAVVTDARSLVWDISSIQEITTDYNMEIDTDDVYFEVWFDRTLEMSGSGKLLGSGPGQFRLAFEEMESGVTEQGNFEGTQKTVGTVSSTSGLCKVRTTTSISGRTDFVGENRLLKATEVNSFTINNMTLSASGSYTTTASASGLGSTRGKHSWFYPSLDIGTGHWILRLHDLTTTGNKVTGTATVTLHSGATHQFSVKGAYNAKTQLTKLVLMGQGTAKGANLTVTVDEDQIVAIKGRIFGQMVNVEY